MFQSQVMNDVPMTQSISSDVSMNHSNETAPSGDVPINSGNVGSMNEVNHNDEIMNSSEGPTEIAMNHNNVPTDVSMNQTNNVSESSKQEVIAVDKADQPASNKAAGNVGDKSEMESDKTGSTANVSPTMATPPLTPSPTSSPEFSSDQSNNSSPPILTTQTMANPAEVGTVSQQVIFFYE